ncbi:M56 family metallopeptidase [Imperialibacter roseus]|uniref:M56 family metallopeptidase n=1 Tax=Imperialibacter roseus TaxID=1324217 RepID=A0ABZ0IPV8_9BACT|nr:M56 family metallopeptidase [Imperialibacter roseus]WOK07083.1 M56 family metallopeptidase [Imperialibacter roseus]
MTNLLLFLFQSVACSLVFYAIYYLVLRNESCYAFNRYYLLSSVLFAVIFPLVKVDLPWALSREVTAVITLPEMVVDPYANYYSGVSWLEVVYAVGIAFFIAKLVLKVISVAKLITSAEKETHHDYVLVRTKGKLPTFSFMHYLFWDDTQELGEGEQLQILKHELAHIRRKHSRDILFIEIAHAIMWFNPIVYAIKNALVMTHEFEADDKATEGRDIEAYQKLLAKQVLNQYGLELGSHFNQSQTLKRLRMLTNKNNNVYWGKFALPVLAMALVFGVVSCELPGVEEDQINIQAVAVSEAGGEEIFTVVEEMPTPPGGMQAFYTYVGRYIKYPQQARRLGVEGKVFVQFIIEEDGSISNIQTIKGIGAGCDLESERVIAGSPKWNAGRQRGRAVKTRMILPITFKLDRLEGEDRVVGDLDIKINEEPNLEELTLVGYQTK